MDIYEEILEKTKTSIKFKEGVIHEIMKLYISDPKVRLSTDAVVAINEILISFLQETIWRTVNQARNEGMISVNLDHLEKILPQLLLDFA